MHYIIHDSIKYFGKKTETVSMIKCGVRFQSSQPFEKAEQQPPDELKRPALLCQMLVFMVVVFFKYIYILLVICGAERRMMSLSSVVADVVIVGDVTSVC